MATFTYQGLTYYYEVHGEGTPLLLLNGLMMSTKSWTPFIQAFKQHHQLILLDMLDQGQSARATFAYTQAHQVQVVLALLTHLAIPAVHLLGISYGGQVALQLAGNAPERVLSLMVFNTVAETNETLKALGKRWNEVAALGDGEGYYQLTIPVIYSSTFKQEKHAWMQQRKAVLMPIFHSPTFLQAMMRLTTSAETHTIHPIAQRITMRTLIVGSAEDTLTPFVWQQDLAKLIPHAHLIRLEKVGHASMYEKPDLFVSLVLGFSSNQPSVYQI
jgi:pimeloyl-ACP methyl ester carboxylesterase